MDVIVLVFAFCLLTAVMVVGVVPVVFLILSLLSTQLGNLHL